MTRKSKKKRKKQKAGLNKSILDVGFGMLVAAIKYKVEEAGGVFAQVPTKKIKPSGRCPGCGNCEPKTLADRVHSCECGTTLHRDVAAALVCLLWALGKLPLCWNVPRRSFATLRTEHLALRHQPKSESSVERWRNWVR